MVPFTIVADSQEQAEKSLKSELESIGYYGPKEFKIEVIEEWIHVKIVDMLEVCMLLKYLMEKREKRRVSSAINVMVLYNAD